MPSPSQTKGRLAQDAAERYLLSQGLSLIERNFNCRMGEIDLIMKEQTTLVFVEVRQRKSAKWGSALATVTAAKQHKIILTASHYLQKHGLWNKNICRFDVVGVQGETAQWQFRWIPNAFVLG